MNKFEQIHVMGGSPCGRGRDPKWRGEVAVVHTFIDNRVVGRVAMAQGKQGIWFLLFPDRENTGNFALTQGKILRHRENIFL